MPAQNDSQTHPHGLFQNSSSYNGGRKDGQRIIIITAPDPDGGWQNVAECVESLAPIILTALNSHSALVSLLTAFATEDSQCDAMKFRKLKTQARNLLKSL